MIILPDQPPESAPYQGLDKEFARRARNLCAHSLAPEIWENWQDLNYESNGTQIYFAECTTTEQRLDFVDRYLYDLLTPKNMAPPDREMLPRWRADLNKYRGWLLHRVLLQLEEPTRLPKINAIREANREESLSPSEIYTLPEDFPKIVDDLYLFHKHIKGKQANIQSYKNLDQLAKVVEPFQTFYPIAYLDKAAAYAQYMETETPAQLAKLLSENWVVTERMVETDTGRTIIRKGGVALVGTLPDGTEILQIKSEKAAIALGSPRWCTAWKPPHRNYFNTYNLDLLNMIAPDGARWQFHFRSGQWRDGRDFPIDLPTFLAGQPGLGKIVGPFIVNALGGPLVVNALAGPFVALVGAQKRSHTDLLICALENSETNPLVTNTVFNRAMTRLAEERSFLNTGKVLIATVNDNRLRPAAAKFAATSLEYLEPPEHRRSSNQALYASTIDAIVKTSDWHDDIAANTAVIIKQLTNRRSLPTFLKIAAQIPACRAAITDLLPGEIVTMLDKSRGSYSVISAINDIPEWSTAAVGSVATELDKNLGRAHARATQLIDSLVRLHGGIQALSTRIGTVFTELTKNGHSNSLSGFVSAMRNSPETRAMAAPHIHAGRDHMRDKGFSVGFDFLNQAIADTPEWQNFRPSADHRISARSKPSA